MENENKKQATCEHPGCMEDAEYVIDALFMCKKHYLRLSKEDDEKKRNMEANIDKKDEVVFVLRTTCVVVNTEGSRLSSENATIVEIIEGATGEYVEISQVGLDGEKLKLIITKEEWPSIQAAIDLMIRNLK